MFVLLQNHELRSQLTWLTALGLGPSRRTRPMSWVSHWCRWDSPWQHAGDGGALFLARYRGLAADSLYQTASFVKTIPYGLSLGPLAIATPMDMAIPSYGGSPLLQLKTQCYVRLW